eukprot:TRINITY_DN4218_c0_g1_i1.p1 TRINITY_DN4218_c0_g1~~TRINITY_DN4218_c0_g1_i1.p1  ORF type:complete len:953 (+),score=156.22 TRINITY_DN4218_c0_g1_i1:403-2859(+)
MVAAKEAVSRGEVVSSLTHNVAHVSNDISTNTFPETLSQQRRTSNRAQVGDTQARHRFSESQVLSQELKKMQTDASAAANFTRKSFGLVLDQLGDIEASMRDITQQLGAPHTADGLPSAQTKIQNGGNTFSRRRRKKDSDALGVPEAKGVKPSRASYLLGSDMASEVTSDVDGETVVATARKLHRGSSAKRKPAEAESCDASSGSTSGIEDVNGIALVEAGHGMNAYDAFKYSSIYANQSVHGRPQSILAPKSAEVIGGGVKCIALGIDSVDSGYLGPRTLEASNVSTSGGTDAMTAGIATKEATGFVQPGFAQPSLEDPSQWQIQEVNDGKSLLSDDSEVDEMVKKKSQKICERKSFTHRKRFPNSGDNDSSQNTPSGTRLERFVKSDLFETLAVVAVVVSTFLLGMQTNHEARDPQATTSTFYFVADVTFGVFFTVELVLRLYAHGLQVFFCGPAKAANIYDTIMAVTTDLDMITAVFLNQTDIFSYLETLGALRLLRLGKLMRLLRVVSLVQELKMMVYLIWGSVQSFFWALTLMLMMIYVAAIYFTESVTKMVREGVHAEDNVKDQWGSVGASILSLFMSISGGDDWSVFLATVAADKGVSGTINTFLFALYVAFMILVTTNLVTGVFVESAQRLIGNDKDEDFLRKTKLMFGVTDDDGDLEISWEEFQDLLLNAGISEFFKSCDFNESALEGLFDLLDENRSGALSMNEFVMGCMRLRGQARSVDLVHLCIRIEEAEKHRVAESKKCSKMLNLILEAVTGGDFFDRAKEAKQRRGDPRLPCQIADSRPAPGLSPAMLAFPAVVEGATDKNPWM